MIKPTVGRIVWYRPAPDDGDLGQSAETRPGEPFAAIVTHVHDENTVNLSVYGADASQHPRLAVAIFQGKGNPPSTNYAEWMPYQKGQAAKAEQLEQKPDPAPDAPAAKVGGE